MLFTMMSLIAAAFAGTTEVKLTYEVRMQGQQICSGSRVIEAERAVELCARDYNEGTVKFRAKVQPMKDAQYMITGYLTEHDKDGMPVSLSSPQISTLENERGEIATADENDLEVMGFAALVSSVH
jgi:hypothetical protein